MLNAEIFIFKTIYNRLCRSAWKKEMINTEPSSRSCMAKTRSSNSQIWLHLMSLQLTYWTKLSSINRDLSATPFGTVKEDIDSIAAQRHEITVLFECCDQMSQGQSETQSRTGFLCFVFREKCKQLKMNYYTLVSMFLPVSSFPY